MYRARLEANDKHTLCYRPERQWYETRDSNASMVVGGGRAELAVRFRSGARKRRSLEKKKNEKRSITAALRLLPTRWRFVWREKNNQIVRTVIGRLNSSLTDRTSGSAVACCGPCQRRKITALEQRFYSASFKTIRCSSYFLKCVRFRLHHLRIQR